MSLEEWMTCTCLTTVALRLFKGNEQDGNNGVLSWLALERLYMDEQVDKNPETAMAQLGQQHTLRA